MDCSRRGFLLGSIGAGALLSLGVGCGTGAVAPDGTVDVAAASRSSPSRSSRGWRTSAAG